MKAVILAGGLGTRLKASLTDKPKSMAPILGKPFLEYQIEQLKKYGIKDIVLCVAYLADQIKDHFKDGVEFNVSIQYASEKKLLGTGGALKNAEPYLDKGTFLALNGDSYLKINLSDFFQYHKKKKSSGTIALTRVSRTEKYGLVKTDKGDRITGFLEKEEKGKPCSTVNAGVYLFEPEVLSFIPREKKISLERCIFPLLLKKQVPLFGYLCSGYFIDIGTPQKYARIQEDMKELIR